MLFLQCVNAIGRHRYPMYLPQNYALQIMIFERLLRPALLVQQQLRVEEKILKLKEIDVNQSKTFRDVLILQIGAKSKFDFHL